MGDATLCQQCHSRVPPRPDPRGRRAKYCSDACRAAASRERARQRHVQELAAAQPQAVLDFRTPDEVLDEVVQELKAVVRIVQDRGEVPASLRPVVEAAQRLVQTEKIVRVAGQSGELSQRKRRRRRVERKTGQ